MLCHKNVAQKNTNSALISLSVVREQLCGRDTFLKQFTSAGSLLLLLQGHRTNTHTLVVIPSLAVPWNGHSIIDYGFICPIFASLHVHSIHTHTSSGVVGVLFRKRGNNFAQRITFPFFPITSGGDHSTTSVGVVYEMFNNGISSNHWHHKTISFLVRTRP